MGSTERPGGKFALSSVTTLFALPLEFEVAFLVTLPFDAPPQASKHSELILIEARTRILIIVFQI